MPGHQQMLHRERPDGVGSHGPVPKARHKDLPLLGKKVLKGLRRRHLQAEGALEDGLSGEHDLQGGAVTIVTAREIQGWETRLKETDDVIGLPRREE